MELVLNKFKLEELMVTIMELLVAEQKLQFFWKCTFSKETRSTSRAIRSYNLSFPGLLFPVKYLVP